ncbi:taurine dioxygenase [Chromatiales bacterium (ex Bugula neritina AB1)]|nr:taurine dioxygenase [Chromatiales bacterium (ex Bugula neritina AB1)]
MKVEPLTRQIGAVITGIDLAAGLDANCVAELRALWLEYLVIFIRGQNITPEQQMAFALQLGEPDTYPFLSGLSGFPQITEVLKKENETVNFGGVWHTDTCYQPYPPMATMLYAIDIPAAGGDTLFANQYAALASLSDGLASTLKTLRALSVAGNKAVAATRAARIDDSGTGAQADDLHAVHPVVRVHPETAIPALYLSPAHTIRFSGWSEAESAALLQTLFTIQTQQEFCCRFRWQAGDVALWDNRCTLHYPVNDYHGHRRLMHRITLKGDRPI